MKITLLLTWPATEDSHYHELVRRRVKNGDHCFPLHITSPAGFTVIRPPACTLYISDIWDRDNGVAGGLTQQTQNICITFIQFVANVEEVGPTLYKCVRNVLCLLGTNSVLVDSGGDASKGGDVDTDGNKILTVVMPLLLMVVTLKGTEMLAALLQPMALPVEMELVMTWWTPQLWWYWQWWW